MNDTSGEFDQISRTSITSAVSTAFAYSAIRCWILSMSPCAPLVCPATSNETAAARIRQPKRDNFTWVIVIVNLIALSAHIAFLKTIIDHSMRSRPSRSNQSQVNWTDVLRDPGGHLVAECDGGREQTGSSGSHERLTVSLERVHTGTLHECP